MSPETVQAIRYAADDWRREAAGSAAQADRYREQAARLRSGEWERTAEEYDRLAAEHQKDADAAANAVRALEADLRAAAEEQS